MQILAQLKCKLCHQHFYWIEIFAVLILAILMMRMALGLFTVLCLSSQPVVITKTVREAGEAGCSFGFFLSASHCNFR